MKTATAKELRVRAAAILDRVTKGDEVLITKRGKSVAVMKPAHVMDKAFDPVGYGIWKDRKDMKDVKQVIDHFRKERYPR